MPKYRREPLPPSPQWLEKLESNPGFTYFDCVQCGKEFGHYLPQALYCSDDCRREGVNDAQRKRARAKRQAILTVQPVPVADKALQLGADFASLQGSHSKPNC